MQQVQAQANAQDNHGQHGPNAKRVRLAPPGHPGQVNAQQVAMAQQQQQQDFHHVQQQQQQMMFNTTQQQQQQQQNFQQRF